MKTKNAAVALTTVVIMIGLLTFTGVVILLISVDTTRNTNILLQQSQAQVAVTTCREEAIREILLNPSFTGTASFTINNNTCEYTITDESASFKQILTQTLRGGVDQSNEYLVDISQNPYTYTEF